MRRLNNGAGDTQGAGDDRDLACTTLKSAGEEAWGNPKGCHIGRERRWRAHLLAGAP